MILQIYEDDKNHIRTRFSSWWVPPQHRSNLAFPWSCMHTDFRDCSDKRTAVFSEHYESE